MQLRGKVIVGMRSRARPVELEDAEFIVGLRQQSRAQKFLSATTSSVEDQRNWLMGYMERNQNGEDYYFVVTDQAGEDWGVIRIYNVTETECTAGSWVMREGTAPMMLMEAYLIPMFFAFDVLRLKSMHIDVRMNNAKVLAWHRYCGAEFIRSDLENEYFTYSPATYQRLKSKLERLANVC
jgi:hypothetical protein